MLVCTDISQFSLSLPRVINVKFPLQPHQKYHTHSMKELTFHSLLRWKMIFLPVLTTSFIHVAFKGWENNVIFFILGVRKTWTCRSYFERVTRTKSLPERFILSTRQAWLQVSWHLYNVWAMEGERGKVWLRSRCCPGRSHSCDKMFLLDVSGHGVNISDINSTRPQTCTMAWLWNMQLETASEWKRDLAKPWFHIRTAKRVRLLRWVSPTQTNVFTRGSCHSELNFGK